jgi:cysteinyl-tRNA synthetase
MKLPLRKSEGDQILNFWRRVDKVLAFLFPSDEFPPYITDKVKERINARSEKKWGISDEIRDELSKLGYELEDSPHGTTVTGSEGRVLIK